MRYLLKTLKAKKLIIKSKAIKTNKLLAKGNKIKLFNSDGETIGFKKIQ